MIFRTAIEEIIVRTDAENKTLRVHHSLEGRYAYSIRDGAASLGDRDRDTDGSVRDHSSHGCSSRRRPNCFRVEPTRTFHGKGKRWNQNRVATARRNYSIPGQKRALPDPERVSLSEAARVCGVSHRTIERLVEAGLLKREQTAPRAPWEIRRAALQAEPVRSIVERLLRTGKLILQGGCAENQAALFTENEGDGNAGHHE